LKERKERIEGGVGFGEVEKGQGGMGKTTIFFLPPSRYRTEETVWPAGGGGRGAGDLVHGVGREVGQN
jgi:hypothetical protein